MNDRSLITKGFGVVFAMALAALFAAVPRTTQAAEARDLAFTCPGVCETASAWQCCIIVNDRWQCSLDCKPKTNESLNASECIGVAPGQPIPESIQRDLERQQLID